MIGIIVTTCGELAKSFIETVEMVLGKQEALESVGGMTQDSVDDIISKLKVAIRKLQHLDGILILTGIFGESCCNFSLSFCHQKDISSCPPIRVITGVNLPMLFKIFTYRNKLNLDELATCACESGREGIFDATDILIESA